jgi:mannose-6-phosphate isomerase
MEYVDKSQLYPLLFKPIYMERMWGGSKLASLPGREVQESEMPIGESWELVDREDEQSIVTNGPLAGATIRELIEHYGKGLVGRNFSGGKFPLLVKVIDADKRLSLQVHPDQQACQQIGEGAEPKTEMWYIIKADRGAKIMAGISPSATKRMIIEDMNSSTVEEHLQVFPAIPGDAYFITSGTLHAIGSGNLLLEIQQNSDTTYRVSDWGRVDQHGKSRELHIENALEAINFTDRTSPRIAGVSDKVDRNRKFPVVNRCPHFQVDDLRLVEPWRDDTGNSHSFHLVTAINKPVSIQCLSREAIILPPATTCLIPAAVGPYQIIPLEEGQSSVVRTSL